MSFASLGSALLRNNRRLRLRKKNLFEEDKQHDVSNDGKKKLYYKHLSKSQIKDVKDEVADLVEHDKKNKFTAISFSFIITLVIVLLILIFADQMFEAITKYYNEYLSPKDW